MTIEAGEFELALGRGWRQKCIDYGKSKPPLLDDCFIFSHIERDPKRKLKNCYAWYIQNSYAWNIREAESGPDGVYVAREGVPLKVIFPELREMI